MSRKVQQFTNIIPNPLNTHNFIVDIPGFDGYDLIVQATTFPSEQLQVVTCHIQGEEVDFPTIPKNSHEWRITVPENDSGKIRSILDSIKASMYDQKTGLLTPTTWYDIAVYARDLANNRVFHVILHGCWIQGHDPVNLTNSDPTNNWKWDYNFRFQWIEDLSD